MFIAGRPIVEAYRHERRQKWIGIMLADSAIREQAALSYACTIPSSNADVLTVDRWNDERDVALRLQVVKEVPVLSESDRKVLPLDGYAIVPTRDAASPGSVAADLHRHVTTLQSLRLEATDPAAQQKYDPTISWFEALEKQFAAFQGAWKEHSREKAPGA